MVSTDQYLKEQGPQFISVPVPYEKLYRWIHEHPTTIKIVEWLGMIGGFVSIASLPLTIPSIGFFAIPLVAGGLLVGLVSVVAYFVLDLLIGPSHEMQNHVFKEAQCEGARLYYKGDVPILEIASDDPRQAGYAHGFLLAESIQVLRRRYHFAVHTLGKKPTADQLPRTLADIKRTLPPEYITEMEGLRDGFNARLKDFWFQPKPVTFEEILLFHLTPDSCHFTPERSEKKSPEQAPAPIFSPACTVVVAKNKQGEPTLMRNMDWPSFGLFGQYSLVVHRKHQKPGLHSTFEVGLPALIGTLTGVNRPNEQEKAGSGLALAMNVCSGNTQKIQGTPACLYNRYCLEHFTTVDAVEKFVSTHRPLGDYHLTVADSKTAASFHMGQGAGDKHYLKRSMKSQPLVVTNCRYAETSSESFTPLTHMHCSREREQMLDQFFKGAQEKIAADQLDIEKLLERSRSFPFVNNIITTHSLVMRPGRGEMDVAFNNSYAGNTQLQQAC